MDDLNNNSIEKKDKAIKTSESTCFFMDVDDLINSKERQKIFLDNVKNINDINIGDFDSDDDIFDDITYHNDLCEFIDKIVFSISGGKYSFLNSYDENNFEYTPIDPDFRLIDIKKHETIRVDMFMDHLRNGDFEKADDLNIEALLIIDHRFQGEDINIKEALLRIILETKVKAPDLHEKLLDLFYTSEEKIERIVKEEVEYRFDSEEIKDIGYESYQDFYGSVLSKIPNNILYDNHGWDDLMFQVKTCINGEWVEAEFTPTTEFKTVEEAIENVKKILKTAKIIEGNCKLLNPTEYDGLQNGKDGLFEFDDVYEKFNGDYVFLDNSCVLYHFNPDTLESDADHLDDVKLFVLSTPMTRDEMFKKIMEIEKIDTGFKDYGEYWKIVLPSEQNVDELQKYTI